MTPHDSQPPERQVPLSWVGYDEVPIVYANQFLVQHQDGQFVVAFGQFTLPALLGSPEELEEQLSEIEFVPVRPLNRFVLPEGKMRELIAVLEASLSKAERFGQPDDPRGDET